MEIVYIFKWIFSYVFTEKGEKTRTEADNVQTGNLSSGKLLSVYCNFPLGISLKEKKTQSAGKLTHVKQHACAKITVSDVDPCKNHDFHF